jgi:CheY-like chemotaxis protein
LGKGSTFTAIIPYRISHEEIAPELTNSRNYDHDEVLLDGISVLVAEDNTINQKVVKNTLQKQGASVHIVGNGQEAIDALLKNDYDVVLMDLQMPEVDGYKATRYIREVMRKELPILAMTADALKGEAEKCFDVGMTGFISKPFEPRDLYHQILQVTSDQKLLSDLKADQPLTERSADLVDFSFLFEISEMDPKFISDVLAIFLETMPEGLDKLDSLIKNGTDWDAISKQAHFLKSSTSVIKLRDMFEQLHSIEKLAKEADPDIDTIKAIFAEIQLMFIEAHPFLISENERYKKELV